MNYEFAPNPVCFVPRNDGDFRAARRSQSLRRMKQPRGFRGITLSS